MVRLGSGMALMVAVAVTAAPPQQQPTFKTGTQTVPLFVTVTDASGRLIPDLAQEDFEVFDKNKSQAVVCSSTTSSSSRSLSCSMKAAAW